ncbi:MAG TPA: tetratricopeptide repeat protein [Flavobacterium sp.]|jgi:tetratricopeptide (TPR) repeat protein
MKKIILYSLLLFSFVLSAQEKDKDLPRGNESFKGKDYAGAEAQYRVSQSKFLGKATSSYNLGNSIYRQNQVSEAKSAYLKAIQNARTRPQKHYAFHNLGNVFMKEKQYDKAVEAYKNALRNNPADEESRYNYALAKEYLKNNPPKDDKKKDDKKDDKKNDKKDKDQKKDDKNQDKKEGDDKKDQKDQDKGKDKENDKQGDKPEERQPKPAPGGISKQRVENLLDAVNNEERKVQDKVNAKKVKAKSVNPEKDW